MITDLSTTPGPDGSGMYPLRRLHAAQRGLHQGDPVWGGSASRVPEELLSHRHQAAVAVCQWFSLLG